jgi:ATP-dependent DNA helicase RecG
VANLNDDIRFLKGVGEKRAQALEKLGIRDLRGMISCYPRRYEDRSGSVSIAAAVPGENACICAMVAAQPQLHRVRRGMELVKVRAVDDTGALEITFFNQSYIRTQLIPGESYRFFGRVSASGNRKAMINPVFEDAEGPGLITGRIVPVYPLTAGVNQGFMMKTMLQALENCGDTFPNYLPETVAAEHGLARAKYAYHNIHLPESMEALELARRRLIFEEFFVLACALKLMGSMKRRRPGAVIDARPAEEFFASLPFRPTGAQARACGDVLTDMRSGRAMNRLVQGDVGSGKTLVAAAAVWAVCRSGRQSALMAPTEILARQHFETMEGFLAPFGINVRLLTGSMSIKEKREALSGIKSGEVQLVVGTHALISQGVEYRDLALVVTDEQHRFGVKQRGALSEKAESPHVLVMSATPIPRTLALMLYGDLDVSVIDELPPGRQKVDTFAVDSSYRPRLDRFIEKLVAQGRQVFVVCPRIDDEELGMENLRSAEEHAKYLTGALRGVRVTCVHGRMKPKEKDAVMSAFAAGESDVLVSTTVIEVGVDVPNAALMIVENAERFGLSQLHQLRGRVGRGSHKSYCVLVSDAKNEDTRARLEALCKTNDGFKLAEEDLRMRGPGDFFGSRQHGLPEMHIADLCTDTSILVEAQSAAQALLEHDPMLNKAENAALLARLEELFDLNLQTMN